MADVDDVAMGIYATAGFAETERIVQIERRPVNLAAANGREMTLPYTP